jgi:hypothetical protein
MKQALSLSIILLIYKNIVQKIEISLNYFLFKVTNINVDNNFTKSIVS